MPLDVVTDRVRINDLTPSDAQALFLYRSDAEVARHQSWQPDSVDEARDFIVRNAAKPFDQAGSWYQLAVRSGPANEVCGDLGLHFLGDGCQVEIGFTIAPSHQRQGLGTLAVIAMLDYLFTCLNKHRVTASVDPGNAPSLALLRRVGMRQEAHFRQSLFWKGEWVDDVVFGMLRSEWKARAAPERGATRSSLQ